MSKRFWASLAITAGVFAIVQGPTKAQQQGTSAASKIQEVVESCFSSPPGATGKIVVSATFGPDGSLKDKPEIVRKGEGPINNTFADAAVRAILKCEPRLVGLGLQGKVTFNFDPSGLLSASHDSTSAEVLADPLNGEQLTTEVNGKRIELSMPNGFCRVAPDGTPAEKEILRRARPPADRKADLLAMGVDCETSNILKAGKLQRWRRMISLNLLTNDDLPTGEAYLAAAFQRFSAREPLTPRYWQSPPIGGSPVVSRDDRAVYVAQRIVKDGNVTVSGVSAYATVENLPLIVNIMSFDGTDVSKATVTTTVRTVSTISVTP
ncbi:hypothetical protein [Mesorhizobium sp. YR577]|uniref:hypothetical protein n=1 Tax=Mesorhizobium sp. YR577 TaxID=1884373 RepID=UPI0008EFDEEE|nr:hypothetical protein [Mesorhizobium sp. YR577]SFU22283.1 hypothetical protein SAMN05518861_1348 [Mesorhizobium sp. YR577]